MGTLTEVMVEQYCQSTTDLHPLKRLVLCYGNLVLVARVGILVTAFTVLMGLGLLGKFLASLASVFSSVKWT